MIVPKSERCLALGISSFILAIVSPIGYAIVYQGLIPDGWKGERESAMGFAFVSSAISTFILSVIGGIAGFCGWWDYSIEEAKEEKEK